MEIAVPEGIATVIVGCHDGKYYVNVSGMETASKKSLKWMDEDDLLDGTGIEVTCCDVSEPAVPASSIPAEEDTLKRKLEKYRYALHLIDELRPELVKAGLVSPEE